MTPASSPHPSLKIHSDILAVGTYLVNERGVDNKRIRASACWRRGTQAAHEAIEGRETWARNTWREPRTAIVERETFWMAYAPAQRFAASLQRLRHAGAICV